MGRTIDEVIAALPRDSQERIDERYRELKQKMEGLRQLRQSEGEAQLDMVVPLKSKRGASRHRRSTARV